VRLWFDDGLKGTVDLADRISQGGALARLQDPQFFSQVTIGHRGRSLEWPGEFDLCADALWRELSSAVTKPGQPVEG
jgi:hypothetical protein